MVKCVKASLKDAQKVKRDLIDKDLLNNRYFTKKDNQFIYFPVKEDYNGEYETEDTEINSDSKFKFSCNGNR
mgnify:CR=1 FL=1